jgi:hypothetical protein
MRSRPAMVGSIIRVKLFVNESFDRFAANEDPAPRTAWRIKPRINPENSLEDGPSFLPNAREAEGELKFSRSKTQVIFRNAIMHA